MKKVGIQIWNQVLHKTGERVRGRTGYLTRNQVRNMMKRPEWPTLTDQVQNFVWDQIADRLRTASYKEGKEAYMVSDR